MEGGEESQPKLIKDEVTGEMVSKNELKKREKMRKKELAAKEKAEKKAKEAADKPEAQKKESLIEDETDLDPSKYTEARKEWIQHMRESGENPYPHKFHRTHSIPEVIS